MIFFFFKQKTAYEMRISDWSSDVCSSDLRAAVGGEGAERVEIAAIGALAGGVRGQRFDGDHRGAVEIDRRGAADAIAPGTGGYRIGGLCVVAHRCGTAEAGRRRGGGAAGPRAPGAVDRSAAPDASPTGVV